MASLATWQRAVGGSTVDRMRRGVHRSTVDRGEARGGMGRVHVDRPCGGAGVAVHGGPRPWRGEQRAGGGAAAGGGAIGADWEVPRRCYSARKTRSEGRDGYGSARRARWRAYLREATTAKKSLTAVARAPVRGNGGGAWDFGVTERELGLRARVGRLLGF